MFDLDAYLDRLGLTGRPDLAELHRAHVAAIPFENLDPHNGVPVSLDADDLQRKLVNERRGGYCFEQNLLLKAALEALGAEGELMLARVRSGAPPGTIRPRSHLVLRVQSEGSTWHADVGFGLGTLLEPIPFGPGEVHEQSGWRFRVVEEGEEFVLQTADGADWNDLYAFDPQGVPLIDVATRRHAHLDERLERACSNGADAHRERRDSGIARRNPTDTRRAFRPPRLRTQRRGTGCSGGADIPDIEPCVKQPTPCALTPSVAPMSNEGSATGLLVALGQPEADLALGSGRWGDQLP